MFREPCRDFRIIPTGFQEQSSRFYYLISKCDLDHSREPEIKSHSLTSIQDSRSQLLSPQKQSSRLRAAVLF